MLMKWPEMTIYGERKERKIFHNQKLASPLSNGVVYPLGFFTCKQQKTILANLAKH